MKMGFFIIFEGGEKVGKTTQIQRAKEYITQQKGYEVIVTREPGGGDPRIREKLLDLKGIITPEEELDLFCKDRALHIKHVVQPALERDAIVLCDRFEPSTIAYQGYGRGMDISIIKEKSARARGAITPTMIILLDADPATVLHREEATSRFDAETFDFHKRVRQGFLAQAIQDPAHWRVINAAQQKDAVWNEIKQHIDALLTQ